MVIFKLPVFSISFKTVPPLAIVMFESPLLLNEPDTLKL